MKNFRRQSPTVNAGSMADIAFLLLIFFLVTTTISADKGILRTLPRECQTNDCTADIAERNILKILINKNNEVMIDDVVTDLHEVKTVIKTFIDNNGNGNCDYCLGEGIATLSDEPAKAVVSLKTDALANYKTFIAVQDEVSKAYFELRKHYAKTVFKKDIEDLTEDDVKALKLAYPFILSEAETKQ